MKPVLQSIAYGGSEACDRGQAPGDCLRACVASIFELDLTDVPHFCATGPLIDGNENVWWWSLVGFLTWHGAYPYQVEVFRDERPLPMVGWSILTGPSPRAAGTKLQHSVVGFNGDIVHDPHPSGDGLETVTIGEIIVPFTLAARELLGKGPVST